ncbi:MAG TPA: hypothetical protein VGZ03_00400 [Acidimicrobiales bacterium]|nr:hypothetical protein [Acidimicrobiales bacterium]
MAQSTTKTQQASGRSPKEPRREIGWTPFLIGGAVVLVVALVLSLTVRGSSAPNGSTTSTTVAPGTLLWTGEVTLGVARDYGLEHPTATVDNSCNHCTIVEGVFQYGMAISNTGGLQVWPAGAPTYLDCANALSQRSLPAVALYDPPTYTGSSVLRPGAYLCALGDNGNVVSLRYDGPVHQGNAFKFYVTSWTA